MNGNINKAMIGALVLGLVAGSTAMATDGKATAKEKKAAAGKDACKGKDGCKGKESCKGKDKAGHDKASCKGHDAKETTTEEGK